MAGAVACISKTHASLRIAGDDLDPASVTALLGGEPTTAHHRKGDAFGTAGMTRRFGCWRRVARPRVPGDLDDQVRELFTGLTDDAAIWLTLSAKYQIDVFCGLFLDGSNEGIDLTPETMTLLGSRGISIGFDIYGARPTEADP